MINKESNTRFSVVEPGEIAKRVMPLYGISRNAICKFYLLGVSDIYEIISEDSSCFLRLHRHASRTKAEILSEIDLIRFLHEEEIPVAPPLPTLNGEFVTELDCCEGRRYAVVFEGIVGGPLNSNSKTESYRFGELAGRFHQKADSIKQTLDRPRFDIEKIVWNPISLAKQFVSVKDHEYLCALGRKIESILKNLPTEQPYWGICHGDLNSNNVIVNGDKLTLIDLESCGFGWRIRDLVSFFYEECFQNESAWKQFIEGYCSIRPLSTDEYKSIPALLAVYHLEVIRFTIQTSQQIVGESIVVPIVNNIICALKNNTGDTNISLPSSWNRRWGANPSPSPSLLLLR